MCRDQKKKKEWFKGVCAEVEELARNLLNKMYNKIRRMTGNNLKHASSYIMKADEKIAMKDANTLERREEHVGQCISHKMRIVYK